MWIKLHEWFGIRGIEGGIVIDDEEYAVLVVLPWKNAKRTIMQ